MRSRHPRTPGLRCSPVTRTTNHATLMASEFYRASTPKALIVYVGHLLLPHYAAGPDHGQDEDRRFGENSLRIVTVPIFGRVGKGRLLLDAIEISTHRPPRPRSAWGPCLHFRSCLRIMRSEKPSRTSSPANTPRLGFDDRK
jgi:hypothetical protein